MSLGYDLRIVEYPYSDRLATKAISSENIDNPFLRPVLHGIPKTLRDKTNNDLAKCLNAIDAHHRHLAEAIGGIVVNHEWVLTKDTYIRSKVGTRVHLDGLALFDKPGLWLGAIVDWAPGIAIKTSKGFNEDMIKEAGSKLREARESWILQEGWSSHPGELTDTSQFVSTVNPNEATLANLNPTLVDIDIL